MSCSWWFNCQESVRAVLDVAKVNNLAFSSENKILFLSSTEDVNTMKKPSNKQIKNGPMMRNIKAIAVS